MRSCCRASNVTGVVAVLNRCLTSPGNTSDRCTANDVSAICSVLDSSIRKTCNTAYTRSRTSVDVARIGERSVNSVQIPLAVPLSDKTTNHICAIDCTIVDYCAVNLAPLIIWVISYNAADLFSSRNRCTICAIEDFAVFHAPDKTAGCISADDCTGCFYVRNACTLTLDVAKQTDVAHAALLNVEIDCPHGAIVCVAIVSAKNRTCKIVCAILPDRHKLDFRIGSPQICRNHKITIRKLYVACGGIDICTKILAIDTIDRIATVIDNIR